VKTNPKQASNAKVDAPPTAPSRSEALEAAWHDFFTRAREMPAHAGARDFLYEDMKQAFSRIVPADASVLEVGCGEGDLLAALPNARRMGIDYLPDAIERARARHPDISFEVGDATAGAGARIESAASGAWDAVICDRLCHSVLDVKALLLGLKRQLAPGGPHLHDGRSITCGSCPVRLAEMTGWKRPAPDVELAVRLRLPQPVRHRRPRRWCATRPPADAAGGAGRGAGAQPLPRARAGDAVRVALPDLRAARSRHGAAAPRRASVSVIVPTRNEAGNVAAALARTPVMGSGTELIFVEGHSTDDTWETIQAEMKRYSGR
jgi:SAM-dependent methyltransferase